MLRQKKKKSAQADIKISFWPLSRHCLDRGQERLEQSQRGMKHLWDKEVSCLSSTLQGTLSSSTSYFISVCSSSSPGVCLSEALLHKDLLDSFDPQAFRCLFIVSPQAGGKAELWGLESSGDTAQEDRERV